MKNRLIGLLAVMCLLLVGMGLATTITSDTADNAIVTGATQFLNASISPAGDDVSNVTFEYKLSGGSWVFINDVINDSDDDAEFNITWDTTVLTDDSGVTLNISAYNSSDSGATWECVDSLKISSIDIDNTNPTSSYGTATPSDKTTSDNTTLVVVTASDASLDNCTLTLNPKYNETSGNSYFVAASGNVCTWYLDAMPDESYDYYFVSQDNLNSSTSAIRIRTIDTTKIGFVPEEVPGIPIDVDKKALLWIIILAVIVIVIWRQNKK